jgi:hypothetical protein
MEVNQVKKEEINYLQINDIYELVKLFIIIIFIFRIKLVKLLENT